MHLSLWLEGQARQSAERKEHHHREECRPNPGVSTGQISLSWESSQFFRSVSVFSFSEADAHRELCCRLPEEQRNSKEKGPMVIVRKQAKDAEKASADETEAAKWPCWLFVFK